MTRVAAAGRLLRAVAALAVLVGLLAGTPWGLVVVAGWPLPDHIPALDEVATALTSPLSDTAILDLLAVLAWALWLLFVRDVLVEAILTASEATHTRQGAPRPTRRHPASPVRLVAAILIGAIASAILQNTLAGAVTAKTSRAAAATDTAAALAPAPPGGPVEPPVDSGPRRAVQLATATHQATTVTLAATGCQIRPNVPGWAHDTPGGVHHVVKGDNLWDIAESKLGDPYRWREIYLLNRGKPQANGYTLHDPDEIHIGWVLALPARDPTPPPVATPPGHSGEQTPPPATANPAPANPAPTHSVPTMPSATPPPTTPPPNTSAPASTAPATPAPAEEYPEPDRQRQPGVTLPSQAWISLGLATTIATVAVLLRLQQRRRARLGFPIPVRTGRQPAPVPESVAMAETVGSRQLDLDTTGTHCLPGVLPTPPAVRAPVGVDEHGGQISLFDLPGPGLALHGHGAPAVARAILASTLATGTLQHLAARPVVVTTLDTLTRLLPPGAPPVGLDPDHTTFDGERLHVLADTAAAITHTEQEMIHRRRLLDTFDVDTVADLNARTDHAEHQPAYLLLLQTNPRYTARIHAVAAHRAALDLHTVILGDLDSFPNVDVAADGTPTTTNWHTADGPHPPVARLATLSGKDLADVLAMLAEAAPRPEPGTDLDEPADPFLPTPPTPTNTEVHIPTSSSNKPAPVRLCVLGPITLATDAGTVTTGMRSGSYAVLALLAAHPHGRTLDQIAADLHPDADPHTAANRARTDITTIRRVLRAATGHDQAWFIVHDQASGRYHIDPDTIEVDLWQMLAAITHANHITDDDTACLAALRQAADCYRGDFAQGQDRAWSVDYATTYRHQILGVYARIAELLETDHPDQAITALERAVELDPVNEELYQRIMRIHGRQRRPDAVRRMLRLLENRLADLGEAEVSEATRRVAARQMNPSRTGGG
ncbi:MAG: BTAD domain-containing putative transcriptional regulator [Pseudonocardiaceae bacterium]